MLRGIRKRHEAEITLASGVAFSAMQALLARMAQRTGSRRDKHATKVEAGRLIRLVQGTQAALLNLKACKRGCSTWDSCIGHSKGVTELHLGVPLHVGIASASHAMVDLRESPTKLISCNYT